MLDDKLAEHLAVLGIDVSTQVKTEKTMAELNLDANLNLTLSKVLEEGKQLIPVFGPGLTGMENLGNSCYMNDVRPSENYADSRFDLPCFNFKLRFERFKKTIVVNLFELISN